MPIESICPTCSRTLRVADEHAGKQARCPVCQNLYTVTAASGTPTHTSSESGSEPHGSGEKSSETPGWLLKTPEGAMYGPVDRATLDRWLADGRIAADCHLAQGDRGAWRPAAEVYPQLVNPPATPRAAPTAGSSSSHSYSNTPRASTVGYQAVPGNVYLRPHRGGLILALGILGLVSCQVLGVAAWIMGADDIKEMRAGRMDPSGEGLTQAGYALGMVSTILLAVGLASMLLFMLFFAVMAVAAH